MREIGNPELKTERSKQINSSIVRINITEEGNKFFFGQPLANNYPVDVLAQFLAVYSKWIKEDSAFNFSKEFSYHFNESKLIDLCSKVTVLPLKSKDPEISYEIDLDKKEIRVKNKEGLNTPFLFERGNQEEKESMNKILHRIYFLGFRVNEMTIDSLKSNLLLKVM